MINYKANPRFKASGCLTVPSFQKNTNKIQTKADTIHKSRLNSSDLTHKNNRFVSKSITLTNNQFKSRLQSYLEQNEQHLKQATQQGQRQRLISSSCWIKINKEYSFNCKNQSRSSLMKRSCLKKNIKQYITETALAKRKRNTVKTSSSADEEPKNLQVQLKTFRSLLITNKWNKKDRPYKGKISEGSSVDKMIPIHHTQIYFSQKQFTKRSNLLYNNQSQHQTLQLDSKKEDTQQNLRATEPLLNQRRKTQTPFELMLETNEQEIFQKKIRYKRQNYVGKFTKTSFPKQRKAIKQYHQQIDISPWKPRNTVQSQLSIRELQ